MINHNTIFTFWGSEAYVLRLGELPNNNDDDNDDGQQRAITYGRNEGPTVLSPWMAKKAQVTLFNLCSIIHNESEFNQKMYVQLRSHTPSSSPYSSDIMTPIMPNPNRDSSGSEPLRIASYCRTSSGPKSDVVYSLIFDEWTGKIAACTVPEPARPWQSRAAAGVTSCSVTIIDLLGGGL
jgi:hypothetical protein